MNEIPEMSDPAFDGLVAALRAAPQRCMPDDFVARTMRRVAEARREEECARRCRFRRAVGLAASLAVLLTGISLWRGGWPGGARVLPDGILPADGLRARVAFAPYLRARTLVALTADSSTPAETLARAVEEIARDQRVDGGWGSVVLSRDNTSALGAAVAAGSVAARRPWKRGLRYLRAHGVVLEN